MQKWRLLIGVNFISSIKKKMKLIAIDERGTIIKTAKFPVSFDQTHVEWQTLNK